MSRLSAERAVLARFAAEPTGGAAMVRTAVLLARTECPDADPERVEAMLEGLGAEVGTRTEGPVPAARRAEVLAQVLAGERGLRGNRAAYEDPRNSCLECVLDRRLGIPLPLSLVWMEVGRRAGWRVEGVGLPGHFVVRVHGGEGDAVLADPFHGGAVVAPGDLNTLLHGIHGKPVPLRSRDLDPMAPRDVLLRLLRNLRGSYRRRGDRARSLAVAEDMLLLAPGLPEALRDRGLLRLESGDRGGIADLRDFLGRAPRAAGADAVLRLVHIVTDDAELPN